MNKHPLTLSGFNLNLFTTNKRQESHDRVDWFADELDVWWLGSVHLETSKQCPLTERKRMIAEERIVIT